MSQSFGVNEEDQQLTTNVCTVLSGGTDARYDILYKQYSIILLLSRFLQYNIIFTV